VQHWNVFIIEFLHVIKLANIELFKLSTNPYPHFENSAFDAFKFLINHLNEQLPLKWWSNLAHPTKILKMKICDSTYGVDTWIIDGLCHPIFWKDATTMTTKVQVACIDTSIILVSKLQCRFLDHEIMRAMGMVCPQYWLNKDNYDASFSI
jgi:hypothetical protein